MKNLLNKIILGDTLAILKKMDSDSVDLGVTSPPYNKQENKTAKIKIDIVIARGKKKFDKRETTKKRDTERETRREFVDK